MKDNIKRIYICNKQDKCNGSSRCGVECNHTKDYNYAKNKDKKYLLFKPITEELHEEVDSLIDLIVENNAIPPINS